MITHSQSTYQPIPPTCPPRVAAWPFRLGVGRLIAFQLCIFVGGSWGLGWGQEVRQGAVLLKETDRVLVGRILQRADFYEIQLGPNSRISLPTDKVAQVAGSLEELYQIKRSRISQASIGDHFQLTRWCLVNGLLPQAVEHYAVVVQRNATHPRVKQLGVELEAQLLRDEAFRQYLGLAPLVPAASAVVPSQVVANGSVAASSVVSASTFEANSVQYPEIAQRFSQRVEPILINRCSQAACHGVQSSNALRLLEPYGRTHAQTTSDNLASALKQVSGDSNQLSSLLQYATQAHGTQRAPAIPVTDSKLVQELQDWIDFVHDPVVSAVATGAVGNREGLLNVDQHVRQSSAGMSFGQFGNSMDLAGAGGQPSGLNQVAPGGVPLRRVPLPDNSGAASARGPQQPTPFPASGFPVGSQPPSLAELEALDAQLKAALGETTPIDSASSSLDPFDPREFNRKAHSQH